MQPLHKDKLLVDLLWAIGEICTTFQITETDISNQTPEALLAIKQADAQISDKPRVVNLTIVYRNGTPNHAFLNRQAAINYCIRTRTTELRATHHDHEITLKPSDMLLTAELTNGEWTYEAHDDERCYHQPLLIVPIQ